MIQWQKVTIYNKHSLSKICKNIFSADRQHSYVHKFLMNRKNYIVKRRKKNDKVKKTINFIILIPLFLGVKKYNCKIKFLELFLFLLRNPVSKVTIPLKKGMV